MNTMMLLILASILCVLASLGMGIVAMARHGEAGHRSSADWMSMRVMFQALAVVLMLVTLWT